jgi:hypothetical protein
LGSFGVKQHPFTPSNYDLEKFHAESAESLNVFDTSIVAFFESGEATVSCRFSVFNEMAFVKTTTLLCDSA